MSEQWAKSVSYRDALNTLQERFAILTSQDRVVSHELFPNISSIDGYLFAINAAPAKVSPTDWLGELLPLIQRPDEAPADSVNLLISYALHSKARQEQQKYALPETGSDPIKALQPGSPLNSFSHGFEVGYRRVESIWSALVAEELRKELESQRFALTFFASADNARAYLNERQSSMRPDQLAEQVLKTLPQAADLHVRLGMATEIEKGAAH